MMALHRVDIDLQANSGWLTCMPTVLQARTRPGQRVHMMADARMSNEQVHTLLLAFMLASAAGAVDVCI